MEHYLRDLARVLGVGACFAAIPLFASFAELQPPWPPAIGYVSAALVLVAALLAWEWTRRAKLADRRRWIVIAATLTLIGLLFYLFLYSLFVETVTGTNDRIVRGFACTFEAKLIHANHCLDLPRKALEDVDWDPAALWTRASLATVRIGLTTAWLIFIAGLVSAVGSIVAGRRRVRASHRNKGSASAECR